MASLSDLSADDLLSDILLDALCVPLQLKLTHQLDVLADTIVLVRVLPVKVVQDWVHLVSDRLVSERKECHEEDDHV